MSQATKSRRSFLALGLLALAPAAVANDGVYLEQNGLVIIQLESTIPNTQWVETAATPGHTGSGYLRWAGPNSFATVDPATSFGFNVQITNGGFYWLNLRNRHEHPDPTEENDVWCRMDGGTWWKVFSNGPQSVGGWTWESRVEDPGHTYPQMSFTLSPGLHRIEFAARSHGFKMDRLHLARPGTDQYNETLPESPCRVGAMYGNANANSTGAAGLIESWGSNVAGDNNLRLEAYQLPQNAIGFFIVGDGQLPGNTNAPGSSGRLLVGPSVGRYSGTLLTSNAMGRVSMPVNLQQLPRPSGPVAVMPGQTWNFQFWHRDSSGGTPTSNFTRGLSVQFD